MAESQISPWDLMLKSVGGTSIRQSHVPAHAMFELSPSELRGTGHNAVPYTILGGAFSTLASRLHRAPEKRLSLFAGTPVPSKLYLGTLTYPGQQDEGLPILGPTIIFRRMRSAVVEGNSASVEASRDHVCQTVYGSVEQASVGILIRPELTKVGTRATQVPIIKLQWRWPAS